MDENKVEDVINIIKDMDTKDKQEKACHQYARQRVGRGAAPDPAAYHEP